MHASFIEISYIGRCFSYKCSLNSEALILKELTIKKPVCNSNSLLDLNSKLQCANLFVAVNVKKPYKLSVINKSGRHKAQRFVTKEFTFAKISKQLQNIPLLEPQRVISIPQRKEELQIKKPTEE